MKLDLPEWAVWFDVPRATDGHPVRHRVLHGGRGGAKSWTIAHKLVERGWRSQERILCTREYQNSIKDSSKKLIEDAIERLGLGPAGSRCFTITEREIRGRNGTVFTFIGLNGKESAIKSLEGYTLVWAEEAATLSQASIDALVPTIRRPGSEIWWSYNPRFASDPVDQMFRGSRGAPPGSVVVEVHWCDNPWFPDVLKRDMEYDLVRDPEKHSHVWLGRYVQRSDTKVFDNWQVLDFEAPENATFRLGADWGFSSDPTVLVRCFVGRWSGEPGASEIILDPKGRCLFVDYEAYKVACAIDETPALFAGTDRRNPSRWQNRFCHPGIPGATQWPITADSARPETIDYMQRRGFRIEAALKGAGSVEDGVEFLRTHDIYVHPRCRHLIDELIHYSWAVDRVTGVILPKLADANNHVIDAMRYALEGVRRARSGSIDFASAGPRLSLGAYGGTRHGYNPHIDRQGGRGWGSVPGLSSSSFWDLYR